MNKEEREQHRGAMNVLISLLLLLGAVTFMVVSAIVGLIVEAIESFKSVGH